MLAGLISRCVIPAAWAAAKPSATPVIFTYASADGTATTADNDYQAVTNTLTFTPGQTSLTVTVPVVQDSKVEGDENFFVNLRANLEELVDVGFLHLHTIACGETR